MPGTLWDEWGFQTKAPITDTIDIKCVERTAQSLLFSSYLFFCFFCLALQLGHGAEAIICLAAQSAKATNNLGLFGRRLSQLVLGRTSPFCISKLNSSRLLWPLQAALRPLERTSEFPSHWWCDNSLFLPWHLLVTLLILWCFCSMSQEGKRQHFPHAKQRLCWVYIIIIDADSGGWLLSFIGVSRSCS